MQYKFLRRVQARVVVEFNVSGQAHQESTMIVSTQFLSISGVNGGPLLGVVTDTIGIVSPNAYHVVTLDGTTTSILASTRLDGFVVTAGEARTAFTD